MAQRMTIDPGPYAPATTTIGDAEPCEVYILVSHGPASAGVGEPGEPVVRLGDYVGYLTSGLVARDLEAVVRRLNPGETITISQPGVA